MPSKIPTDKPRKRKPVAPEGMRVSKPKVAPALPPEKKPTLVGRVKSPDHFRPQATGYRFILTSAQNNTKLHKGFWKSLLGMAKHTGARLMVARYSYNKQGWGNQQITKASKENASGDTLWYDPDIVPYIQNEQIKLADGLVFCGELDILPTAKDPLSGLDNYTGTNSGIIPHAKMHMRSMAGLLSGQPQRFLYTTGTATLRNYIERRAGQIASYHHVYGAMYVEVCPDTGEWFARQLNADDDGCFYDIDTFYTPSGPQESDGGKIINLGDIHAEKSDINAFQGAMNMLRHLRDKTDYVAVHDLLDFEARNHHNKKDPFFLADQHFNGMNTVEENIRFAVSTLEEISRNSDAELLLVRSNHDMAFLRWLKEGIEHDPANAAYFHEMSARMYRAIERGIRPSQYDIYEEALALAATQLDVSTEKWLHIKEDESFVRYDIEFGLHGHLGPNGARGNPKAYRQLGRKLNTGHTHSAGIIDGVWTAGVLASLNMGYNKGPSSWSHSHILTHGNGKRQMISQRGTRWRV